MKPIFALIFLFLPFLVGCGGGGGNDAPLDGNSIVGEYDVNVRASVENGSCALTSFYLEEGLNGRTAVGQTSEGRILIMLPGFGPSLKGELVENTITARGSSPLGGMGASVFNTIWIYRGNDSFDVEYSYVEGFVGQTSDCSKQFEGSARLR